MVELPRLANSNLPANRQGTGSNVKEKVSSDNWDQMKRKHTAQVQQQQQQKHQQNKEESGVHFRDHNSFFNFLILVQLRVSTAYLV